MDDICSYANRPFGFMVRYVRRNPLAHGFILACVIGAVACSVGTQYGVKNLVDTLSQGTNAATAVWIAFAVLFLLIAADNLLWRAASYVASETFVRVTGALRKDLFRHLTGHSPGFFIDRAPASLTSRVTATSNALFTIENMLVWNVIPPCAATIGAVVLVATVSWQIALVLLCAGALVMIAMYRIMKAGQPLHHEFADKAARVDGEMVDVISNMSLVNSFGGLRREHRRFDVAVAREMTARRRSLMHLERLRLLHALTTLLLTFGILGWALKLWQSGAATTGEVVLVCTLGISVLSATRDLAIALVDVTQHIARLSEALSNLLVPHQMRDHPQAESLRPAGAAVEFDSVSFSYPDGRKVFDELNLHIPSGQRVALIGRSGGGKSTLIALLQRFYEVGDGRITIDGQDVSRVTQHSLRNVIAVVPQDISLFHRTVRENIRYAAPQATDRDVWDAAVAARCDSFIRELPQGLDTVLGTRGVKLSGGQRQRIAIARAFLKDAPLLVLDEATSALDVQSEEEIRRALRELMDGRTVISVAHRLSTVRNFDRIVVLQSGGVVEDGAPEDLLRRRGVYQGMVHGEIARLMPAAQAA
jgi:ATP-binding cassette subfamily B protein